MDFSPTGSSVHGILQAGDLPEPGIEPRSPALRHILYHLTHQESTISTCYSLFRLDSKHHALLEMVSEQPSLRVSLVL